MLEVVPVRAVPEEVVLAGVLEAALEQAVLVAVVPEEVVAVLED